MPMLLWTIPAYAVLSTLIHYQLQLRDLMPSASPLEAFGIAWASAGLLFSLVEYLVWALPRVERMMTTRPESRMGDQPLQRGLSE